MTMSVSQLRVHKIESMGTLDGPGIRTVVFLQGCLLHCGYCHNADTWQATGGEWMETEALFDLIMHNRAYFKKRGGVTFSGGEPLLQAKALLPLVKRLKEAAVHVAVDTSGAIWNDAVEALFPYIDLVLLDVKHTNAIAYSALTGGRLSHTILFLERLKEAEKPYWIRQVIISGITDSPLQVKILDALTASPFREKIELLPYHNMGEHKWSPENLPFKIVAHETSNEVIEELYRVIGVTNDAKSTI
jgi:pyruvate formate lyase activating enzyme